MTVAELIRGESKNVEFKEMLPKNSETYTKTVTAYANTQGGKVIFGVVDETREIVGIDEAILFQTMDSIANAVSDSCEPQIVPEIEPYTVDGKTVIVVTVAAEPSRPYYLKSKGKDKGTYIRVAGTTRLASPEKIKELEMEGEKISWDELTCVGFEVTEKAVKKLCKDMNARRREMQEQKGLKEKLPTVARTNLENWKVLKKTNDGYLASNAFALLTADHAIANVFCRIGLIEACGTGLQRIQKLANEYGLPDAEFIEMPETFRVNLYRMISPMEHRRNIGERSAKDRRNIGEKSAEHRRNIGGTSAEHRLNIGGTPAKHRQNIGRTSAKDRRKIGRTSAEQQIIGDVEMNRTQRKIAELLRANTRLTGAALAEQIGISKRNIESNIKKMKELGVLVRRGSPKGGYWEVRI